MSNQQFVIGVDVAKETNTASYALMTTLKSGNGEIILTKGFIFKNKKGRKKFNKEVKRLAKYFNAKIVKENHRS